MGEGKKSVGKKDVEKLRTTGDDRQGSQKAKRVNEVKKFVVALEPCREAIYSLRVFFSSSVNCNAVEANE